MCAATTKAEVDFKPAQTIYTEQYMDLPVNNLEGYNLTNPLWLAANLRSNSFFLLHRQVFSSLK